MSELLDHVDPSRITPSRKAFPNFITGGVSNKAEREAVAVAGGDTGV